MATSTNGEIAGISLTENKVKYIYVEMEHKRYFTVQMPILNHKEAQEVHTERKN